MQLFALAVLALGALNAVLLAVLTARRLFLSARARGRAAIEQELKPAVLAFLEGEGEPPEPASPREREVIADMLGSYARKLRGAPRSRIERYFAEDGTVARDIHSLEAERAGWRRAAAAHRLGEIGSASALPALIAALGDRERLVRFAAARSLGKLGEPDAVEPLLAAAADGRIPGAVAAWALLQIGEAATEPLRSLLSADDQRQRAGAARILGLIGGAADADLVAERLRDSSASVRAAAAVALARLGGPRDFEPLLTALDDRIPEVRQAAATALGRIRDRRALDGLLEHARRDRFEVAQAAAYAAAAIDADAAARMPGAHLAEAVDLARLG
jgi:HEAT repeat protein